MTKEIKYPTEYAPARVPEDGVKIIPPKPIAWEPKDIGLSCKIRPTLGSDGSTFDLELEIRDVLLTAFIRYSPESHAYIFLTPPQDGMRDGDPQTTIQRLVDEISGMLQPIFVTRKIKTSTTAWNGQALALTYWLPSPMGVMSNQSASADYKDPDPERQRIRMVLITTRLKEQVKENLKLLEPQQ